jgi:TM2 domain-containing membrane protein YozV
MSYVYVGKLEPQSQFLRKRDFAIGPRFDTHSKLVGYAFWLFGVFGLHRFYYGKPVSGLIWLLTLGLFGIGWIVDLFLIPAMDREADRKFAGGPIDYNVSWLLLLFLGFFGIHRMYAGKWITGVIYLLTGGLFGIGYLYDFFVLNHLIDDRNRRQYVSI